jgi:hypothetical protein
MKKADVLRLLDRLRAEVQASPIESFEDVNLHFVAKAPLPGEEKVRKFCKTEGFVGFCFNHNQNPNAYRDFLFNMNNGNPRSRLEFLDVARKIFQAIVREGVKDLGEFPLGGLVCLSGEFVVPSNKRPEPGEQNASPVPGLGELLARILPGLANPDRPSTSPSPDDIFRDRMN